MDWIMSEGGPLICMERGLETSWGGVDRLSYFSPSAKTDYDRACEVSDYVTSIPVESGSALIVGEAPLNTSVWYSSEGQIYIVRVGYTSNDADVETILSKVVPPSFSEPIEVVDFSFLTPEIIIFDSAQPGSISGKESIVFSVVPGKFRIITSIFNPDVENSFVLHRFDAIP